MALPRPGSAIQIFLLLTVLLSSVFWGLIIAAGHIGAGGGHYVEALMWCPAIAALVTLGFRGLGTASLGLSRIGGRFALAGYLIPLGYALVGYTVVWGWGLGYFPDHAAIAAIATRLGWQSTEPASFVPLYFILIASTGMIGASARALGEEIGWRGFMAPRLVARYGFTGGAVLGGLIWAVWHMPLLLFADYHSATPWWFAMTCFTVMVVGSSVILTWLRLRSDSVWPCVLCHASHNVFIQSFFTPLTGARGSVTAYMIDEFGVALALTVLGTAILFWRMRASVRIVSA